MLDSLYRLLAYPLTLFYNFSGSYILAMILYGVLIKVVLFPFGIKQQKGMIRQARMRPKEMAIRKRYAGRDDRKTQMKLQEDLQKLYQEEGYNPLSGCGPMLLQLPIIWVLYRIVYEPLKYIAGATAEQCRQMAELAGNIAQTKFSSASQVQFLDVIGKNFAAFKDGVDGFADLFPTVEDYSRFFRGFTLFDVNLTKNPSSVLGQIGENWVEFFLLISIPILVFAAQYVSMKVIRRYSYQPVQDAQAAASMKIMDFAMPLMITFMAFMFPGLLGIYWIVNSVLSMVQQMLLKKLYPIPVFTEEDYKEAEKQINGKHKPVKKPVGSKKKNPKSLHHIDDDEQDERQQNDKEGEQE